METMILFQTDNRDQQEMHSKRVLSTKEPEAEKRPPASDLWTGYDPEILIALEC
jgi:hypothetical protein